MLEQCSRQCERTAVLEISNRARLLEGDGSKKVAPLRAAEAAKTARRRAIEKFRCRQKTNTVRFIHEHEFVRITMRRTVQDVAM